MVPERKQADVLSTVVQLLQEANQRNHQLEKEHDRWVKRYHDLYQDYIALEFSDLCQHCQTTSKENTTEELLLCDTCKQNKDTVASLRQELFSIEKEARYWEECYDTLLEDFYNERSYDGTNGRL